MTGINHALTGALIATTIDRPVLALVAAFTSHFVIDCLPHWDYKIPAKPKLRKFVMILDLVIACILLFALGSFLDVNNWLFIAGGFLAILPDAMWLPHIFQGNPSPVHKNNPLHLSRRAHIKIQWSESTVGAIVELLWFVGILGLIFYAGG